MTIRNTKYQIRDTSAIAHIDADAFFASALQRKNPQLKGKPLLALGMGGGCVIAASYEAKAFGVKTGMRLVDARKLVPHAIAMPADFREACLASDELEAILKSECALVEQMSVDEWFADVQSRPGGIPKDLQRWAQGLQRRMQQQTSLTVSIGIAPSKLLAKMASEYRKPAGITIVVQQQTIPNTQYVIRHTDFLRDRPAEAIPGIGKRRSLHAQANRWRTAWDIATADAETVLKLFGRPGLDMQRELLGECLLPVAMEIDPPKSASRARSFRANVSEDFLWAQTLQHLQVLVLKMRRHQLGCRMVSVWLRDGSYRCNGANSKIGMPANTEEEIAPYVRRCFEKLYTKGESYTQVGVALTELIPTGPRQQSLFEEPKRQAHLDDLQIALDHIRTRHGRSAIQRGSAIPAASNDPLARPERSRRAPPIPLYE